MIMIKPNRYSHLNTTDTEAKSEDLETIHGPWREKKLCSWERKDKL